MKSYLAARAALFKNISFTCACVMGFFSAIAIGVAYVSFSWHLLSLYNSVNAIIIFMFSWWVFGAVLSPITGYFADKFPRQKIIVVTNSARVLLISIFLLFGSLDSLMEVYIFTSLWGVILAFYMPAMLIMIREILIDDSRLLYANSTMDGIFEIGMVAGMSLGGLMVAIFDMHEILYFLLAGTSIALIASVGVKPAREVEKNEGGFIENWRLVYRFLCARRFVFWFYTAQIGFTCLFMVVPIFIAPYAKNILQASSWEFGLIETGFSVGFIIGSLFLPWIADKKGEVSTIIVALAVSSCLYLALALIHSVTLAFILYFFIGMCISCWAIVVTLAQKNTDITLQGKAQGMSYGLSGMMVMCVYMSFFIINNVTHLPSNRWFYFIIVLALLIMYPLFKGQYLQKQVLKELIKN
ncbi:MFS transporter [Fastidiosibacter lacustris]|uniref:MFS transporter n=1 Tax=Fastidiosibacter lacustris TaxID=2056695 RepID=UPI0018647CED|nr:MFS transporter [Fastidiosibacter lacustris]